jgi:hypothetical protein
LQSVFIEFNIPGGVGCQTHLTSIIVANGYAVIFIVNALPSKSSNTLICTQNALKCFP